MGESITWLAIGFCQCVLVSTTGMFWILKTWYGYFEDRDAQFPQEYRTDFYYKYFWYGMFIIALIYTIYFFCWAWIRREQLKIAGTVIDISAEVISDHKILMCIPIFYWFVAWAFYIGWSIAYSSVVGLNEIVPSNTSKIP